MPTSTTVPTRRVGVRRCGARLDAKPPIPRPGGADRYVVLNSGHTFRAAELAKLNYLLFPRWGDWAVLRIDPSPPQSAAAEETVVRAGYFDEQWRVPDQSD